MVNINLLQKPDWYFSKHPFGQVPSIQIGDFKAIESLVVVDYLVSPGKKVLSLKKYKNRCIITFKGGEVPGAKAGTRHSRTQGGRRRARLGLQQKGAQFFKISK